MYSADVTSCSHRTCSLYRRYPWPLSRVCTRMLMIKVTACRFECRARGCLPPSGSHLAHWHRHRKRSLWRPPCLILVFFKGMAGRAVKDRPDAWGLAGWPSGEVVVSALYLGKAPIHLRRLVLARLVPLAAVRSKRASGTRGRRKRTTCHPWALATILGGSRCRRGFLPATAGDRGGAPPGAQLGPAPVGTCSRATLRLPVHLTMAA